VSRFIAEIEGSRSRASRLGTAKSGMRCHIRGWDTGVSVELDVDPETGRDRVRVFETGGSNARMMSKLIAKWTDD